MATKRCINLEDPVFKKLVEETKVNPIILATKVKFWQLNNKIVDQNQMPTAAQLNIDPVFIRKEIKETKPVTDTKTEEEKIEKERQEELDEYSFDIVEKVEDFEATNDEGEIVYIQIRTKKDGSQLMVWGKEKNKFGNTTTFKEKLDKEYNFEENPTAYFPPVNFGTVRKVGERTAEEANLNGRLNKINAKYDAKLDALEEPAATEEVVIEEKVELTDQELLDNIDKSIFELNKEKNKIKKEIGKNIFSIKNFGRRKKLKSIELELQALYTQSTEIINKAKTESNEDELLRKPSTVKDEVVNAIEETSTAINPNTDWIDLPRELQYRLANYHYRNFDQSKLSFNLSDKEETLRNITYGVSQTIESNLKAGKSGYVQILVDFNKENAIVQSEVVEELEEEIEEEPTEEIEEEVEGPVSDQLNLFLTDPISSLLSDVNVLTEEELNQFTEEYKNLKSSEERAAYLLNVENTIKNRKIANEAEKEVSSFSAEVLSNVSNNTQYLTNNQEKLGITKKDLEFFKNRHLNFKFLQGSKKEMLEFLEKFKTYSGEYKAISNIDVENLNEETILNEVNRLLEEGLLSNKIISKINRLLGSKNFKYIVEYKPEENVAPALVKRVKRKVKSKKSTETTDEIYDLDYEALLELQKSYSNSIEYKIETGLYTGTREELTDVQQRIYDQAVSEGVYDTTPTKEKVETTGQEVIETKIVGVLAGGAAIKAAGKKVSVGDELSLKIKEGTEEKPLTFPGSNNEYLYAISVLNKDGEVIGSIRYESKAAKNILKNENNAKIKVVKTETLENGITSITVEVITPLKKESEKSFDEILKEQNEKSKLWQISVDNLKNKNINIYDNDKKIVGDVQLALEKNKNKDLGFVLDIINGVLVKEQIDFNQNQINYIKTLVKENIQVNSNKSIAVTVKESIGKIQPGVYQMQINLNIKEQIENVVFTSLTKEKAEPESITINEFINASVPESTKNVKIHLAEQNVIDLKFENTDMTDEDYESFKGNVSDIFSNFIENISEFDNLETNDLKAQIIEEFNKCK